MTSWIRNPNGTFDKIFDASALTTQGLFFCPKFTKIHKNSRFHTKTPARKTSPFMEGIERVRNARFLSFLEVVLCSKTNSKQDW